MQAQDGAQVYAEFVTLAIQNKAVYTAQCNDDPVALFGRLGAWAGQGRSEDV